MLADLTALRDLKFDTITRGPAAAAHQLSDSQLRQLARLRLTSLSLPGLCDVRRDPTPALHAVYELAAQQLCMLVPLAPLCSHLADRIRPDQLISCA